VTLKGVVVRMEWINPHSWIHIDVKGDDGTVTRWMIEGGTPNTLFRRGFTKESLQAGTEITVEGYARRTARCAPTAATSFWLTAGVCSSALPHRRPHRWTRRVDKK